MNYADAMVIAREILEHVIPGCDEGAAIIAGSLRRKQADVHDIEFWMRPRAGRPAPEFGQSVIYNTHLDKLLYELEDSRVIARIKGGPKYRQYRLNTMHWGIESMNLFKLEFYIQTSPAQWGVGAVIRTGPGKPNDNFSRWCVTNRYLGGVLPDGYKVKHLAVWRDDQLDAKGKPIRGEKPVNMPREVDFLDFLGLGWIEPPSRHARWR